MGQTICRRRALEGSNAGKQSQLHPSALSGDPVLNALKSKGFLQKNADSPKLTSTLRESTDEYTAEANGKSAKFDGKTAEEWKVVGNESVKNGDHATGYDAYSRGLKANPNHAILLSNRALCLEKLGRLEEAVADAKGCIYLKPDFVKSFLRAATILRDLDRPEEALEILKTAPRNSEVEQLLTKLTPIAGKAANTRIASASKAMKKPLAEQRASAARERQYWPTSLGQISLSEREVEQLEQYLHDANKEAPTGFKDTLLGVLHDPYNYIRYCVPKQIVRQVAIEQANMFMGNDYWILPRGDEIRIVLNQPADENAEDHFKKGPHPLVAEYNESDRECIAWMIVEVIWRRALAKAQGPGDAAAQYGPLKTPGNYDLGDLSDVAKLEQEIRAEIDDDEYVIITRTQERIMEKLRAQGAFGKYEAGFFLRFSGFLFCERLEKVAQIMVSMMARQK